MTTLHDIVNNLDPFLRDRLSSITVEHANHWQVRCSYAYFPETPPSAGLELQEHTITVDLSRLPEGVSASAWERWPDSVHPLSVEDRDYIASIEDMIRALDRSEVVGQLDSCRFIPSHPEALHRQPWPKWIIKTHAGSQAERTTWLMSLRRSR